MGYYIKYEPAQMGYYIKYEPAQMGQAHIFFTIAHHTYL